MKSLRIILLLFVIGHQTYAQTDYLTAYINEGLTNNEAVKQHNFQLEKSVYALKEATGLFFPSINLQASYVESRGGRSIDIPTGDLVNPIFENLNAINSLLAPGSPQYPRINNTSEQLNPKNFYNAYFRVAMPLINAEIWYNRSIKKDQIKLQEAEVAIYKRELVKEIKIAYFNYLKATQAIKIYENAFILVKESERVNQKLVDNGKEVVYVLSRSKSELSKLQAATIEATNQQKNAAAYFNFLLNKPLDAEIKIEPTLVSNLLPLPEVANANSDRREELKKLLLAKNINTSVLNLSKASWIPKLGTQIDLGSQATDFKFTSKSQYYLFGISFDWALFSGLRDVYKLKQSKLELDALRSQTKYAESQLKLAATTAVNSYTSSKEQFASAAEQETSSAQYFNLMNKRYKEGQALYIEYLDARNENTLSSLQKSISYFNAWIKAAECERANADYLIPTTY